MTTLLVTGAGGFVGHALCAMLQERGIGFVPVIRTPAPSLPQACIVADIHPGTDWQACLRGVSVVVHLAARVHKTEDGTADRLREYRLINVEATLNLARQCVAAGVRRFVYLSSVKVNGESTAARPFHADDAPAPCDPYGISKCEAEQGLRRLARETRLEAVIIRPPLVYGPGVKANFLALMRCVERGIPLPLASVRDNRRSLVFVGNLADLIVRCASAEAAAGHTFMASDECDVSTAGLIAALARAMGRGHALFPVPPALLRAAASLLGKGGVAGRLLDSLQVDIQSTKNILAWRPPYSFEDGIDRTVRHFLESRGSRQ